MAKEICISSTPHETRLAILEDDQLAEIYYERENEYTLAGSIYNGRVTRVLPGMQSAFVDVGLERDAFLYVTDFLELEDPEETEELEKAAASGGNTPPREVRHTSSPERTDRDDRSGREERSLRSSQKTEPRQEQKQEPRPAIPAQDRPTQDRPAQERPAKDRRLAIEAISETGDAFLPAPELAFDSEEAGSAPNDSTEADAKRWRGRRRRRGGRGGSQESQPETQQDSRQETSEEPAESGSETNVEVEFEIAPEIQAGASTGVPGDRSSSPGWTTGTPSDSSSSREWKEAPRAGRAPSAEPVPFVMPGESLSRYGGAPAADSSSAPEPATPARPASSFKPSTLIESPLEWDGSGLLPGESISRHANRPPEARVEDGPESQGVFTDPAQLSSGVEFTGDAADLIEEEEFVDEITDSGPQSAPEPVNELIHETEMVEEELLPFEGEGFRRYQAPAVHPSDEDLSLGAPAESVEAFAPAKNSPQELIEPEFIEEDCTAESTEAPTKSAEADTSASHHVDPLPPAGFRLFGLGGKKKKEEEEKPAAKQEAKPASVASVSAYAPGSVLIEEDFIEEEAFSAPRPHRRGKGKDQGRSDIEEETLPAQARSGELGELLQEAQLNHRLDLDYDGSNDEDDEEEEDEPVADGQQPAGGEAQTQQRRDRAGRGRRGRGGQPGQQSSPGGSRRGGPTRRSSQLSDLPIISDLLKPGQEILVQIAKEPIAKKGARITSHIALPGRFLVFMPTVTHIGVSRKIESDAERQRLKRILVSERGEASGGFIVRTAAEGASEEDLRADLRFLLHLWNEIKTRSDSSKSPALIYHDLSLIERILRDQVSSNFSNIWVDSEADYERIVRFLNRFSPTLVRRVKLYTKETPLFEHFGIQDEISKALRSKVWLKSGGSIVINQTEALVAIDINTGKYVGKSSRLEDTIVKTNLDAVPEIVRQIRLRDLGGIIVIDFIDMDDRKNRFRVMAALEEALKSDRAPTKVLQFNDFGLVAITRKRVKQSLERTLSVPCPTCQATGMVKSPATVCNEIYTELRKMKKHFEGADVMLRVHPDTVKVLKSNNASWLVEFEELVGKNILIKSDAALHPEQFDIQG
jgi:ribonuclease G